MNNIARNAERTVCGFLAEEHPFVIYPSLLRVCEGRYPEAAILSKIVYWHSEGRLRVYKEGKYWLAKTHEDWYEEAGVPARNAKACIKRLKDRGLIETKYFKFKGMRTVHIRLDWYALKEALANDRSTLRKTDDASSKKQITASEEEKPVRQNMSDQLFKACPTGEAKSVQPLTLTTSSLITDTDYRYIPSAFSESRSEYHKAGAPEKATLDLETSNPELTGRESFNCSDTNPDPEIATGLDLTNVTAGSHKKINEASEVTRLPLWRPGSPLPVDQDGWVNLDADIVHPEFVRLFKAARSKAVRQMKLWLAEQAETFDVYLDEDLVNCYDGELSVEEFLAEYPLQKLRDICMWGCNEYWLGQETFNEQLSEFFYESWEEELA